MGFGLGSRIGGGFLPRTFLNSSKFVWNRAWVGFNFVLVSNSVVLPNLPHLCQARRSLKKTRFINSQTFETVDLVVLIYP